MRISIVTACYNAEKTIGDAMESVLTQRHGGTEIEYIVVDGGSTDGTVALIRDFAERVQTFEHSEHSNIRTFSFRRLSGASTNGWRTTLKINQSDLRALKANGCWSCLPLLYSRYLLKIWGFVFREESSRSRKA